MGEEPLPALCLAEPEVKARFPASRGKTSISGDWGARAEMGSGSLPGPLPGLTDQCIRRG